MAVDIILAEKVVGYMNELVELDRVCIGAMVENRIPCNEALANHASCQVMDQHGDVCVGLLGVLNGLCGIYDDGPKKGWGVIAAEFTEPVVGDLKGFLIIPNK